MVRLVTAFFLFLLFAQPTANSVEVESLQLQPEAKQLFSSEDVKTFNTKLTLLRKILGLSASQHIDKIEVEEILDGAFKGMVSSLDKFSYFFTEEEYTSFVNEMQQKKGVIGIYLGKSEKNKSHIVAKVVATSGAEAAGMLADDIIMSVNGYEITSETPQSELSRRLRGRPGTRVIVKVLRPETRKTLELEITRGLLRNLSSVRTYLVENDILMVVIENFRDDTAKEFLDAVAKVQKSKNIDLAGVIIDLRNNPGGYTRESIRIADKILDQGVILRTKTRKLEKVYRAEAGTIFPDLPLIVLINGATASASEILLAALQDNQKAIVVGTRTYGKGQGQSVISFQDGSGAIKLTDLRTFSPNGKIYHEIGIAPDIEVQPLQVKYEDEDSEDEGCDFSYDGLVDVIFATTTCTTDLQRLTAFNLIRSYQLIKQQLEKKKAAVQPVSDEEAGTVYQMPEMVVDLLLL